MSFKLGLLTCEQLTQTDIAHTFSMPYRVISLSPSASDCIDSSSHDMANMTGALSKFGTVLTVERGAHIIEV